MPSPNLTTPYGTVLRRVDQRSPIYPYGTLVLLEDKQAIDGHIKVRVRGITLAYRAHTNQIYDNISFLSGWQLASGWEIARESDIEHYKSTQATSLLRTIYGGRELPVVAYRLSYLRFIPQVNSITDIPNTFTITIDGYDIGGTTIRRPQPIIRNLAPKEWPPKGSKGERYFKGRNVGVTTYA